MNDIDDERQFAPAADRNKDPILAVLREVLPARGRVLEIASGTGQHVVHFAAALPDLTWAPTDARKTALPSIVAWREAAGLDNVEEPAQLDVTAAAWPIDEADAVFCANMIHIAPWQACLGLLDGAARVLSAGGPLVLYGPFVIAGVDTAPSNVAFDADLRRRDARWGVRALDDVRREAEARDLFFERRVDMPANNQIVVFRRA